MNTFWGGLVGVRCLSERSGGRLAREFGFVMHQQTSSETSVDIEACPEKRGSFDLSGASFFGGGGFFLRLAGWKWGRAWLIGPTISSKPAGTPNVAAVRHEAPKGKGTRRPCGVRARRTHACAGIDHLLSRDGGATRLARLAIGLAHDEADELGRALLHQPLRVVGYLGAVPEIAFGQLIGHDLSDARNRQLLRVVVVVGAGS